jgi:hypothetical protein
MKGPALEMTPSLEVPVRPPELSGARLAQMRAHLLDEAQRDAQRRGRSRRGWSFASSQRRRALILVAAVLGAIYAVPAVAQQRWSWMLTPNATLKPVSQVVTVGKWQTRELLDPRAAGPAQTAPVFAGDVQWVVQAFVSKHRGLNENMLCLALTADSPRQADDLGGGGACGFPVHGLAPSKVPPERLHWVGFSLSIPGQVEKGAPKFLFGPAAANVRTVELEDNVAGQAIQVETHPIPAEVGVDARFWIVAVPPDKLVHTIVPRDEDGAALEHWHLPSAQ